MSAPSFSSFPTNFSSFPDLEAGASAEPNTHHGHPGKMEDGGKVSKDKRERKKGQTKRRLKEKHKRDDIEEPRSHSRRRDVDIKTRDDSQSSFVGASRLFYNDHKGDSLNLTYGGLHSGDVPKYHIVRRGREILGLEGGHVIRREGRGIIIDVRANSRFGAPELSDTRARQLLDSTRVRRLNASSKTTSMYEEVDGFMRLISPRQRTKSYGEELFRLIDGGDGGSDSASSTESNVQDVSEDDSDTSPLSAREENLRRLEQEIKQSPSSVHSWLSLLEHSLSGISSTERHIGKARSDISISILKRAITAHPNNTLSVTLRLKLLRAGEDAWEPERLRSEWEDALRAVKHADLWIEWFDWRMRSSSETIESCLNDAKRAFVRVAELLEGAELDIVNLRVFWRTATFLKSSGFAERGLALFQAQAELSFKLPANLFGISHEQQLDSLEDFWESEAPRVGENLSKGWSSWNPAEDLPLTSHASRPNDRELLSEDPYVSWAIKEIQSSKALSFPLRSSDEDSDDPFCTMLFSDIRPFLIPLRTKRGLVPSLSPLALDERWTEDSYTLPSCLSLLVPGRVPRMISATESLSGAIVGKEKTYRSSFGIVKQWGLDLRGPLEGNTLNGSGRQWESYDGDVEPVRCVFKQLRTDKDEDWDVLSIAFETTVNIKSAVKTSKSILAHSQSSLKFWAAHARLERIRERFDDARKIYVNVLSTLPSGSSRAATIYWDFSEMEWLLGRRDAAVDVALRVAGLSNRESDIEILRAKRFIEDTARQTSECWQHRLSWIKLRALLELLTGTMVGATEVMNNFLFEEEQEHLHEPLAVFAVLMVLHHTVTLKNPAPRAFLRDLVNQYLDRYPNNTILLGIFLECEKGEGIWGRVRELLAEKDISQLGGKTLSRRLSEIWIYGWENGRLGSEIERIRAGLEAAVRSESTRGSPIIWRVFIEVEIKIGSLKQAKAVLFRALGECPMVKELYLLAFGPLRSVFVPRELNTLADAMAERGVRLRHSLEEYLVQEGGTGGRDNDDVLYGGDNLKELDELEYESQELRRLMPY